MKNIRYMFTACIMLLAPVFLAGCWEEIPAGLKTSVSGNVIDTVKQKQLQSVKVIVVACHGSFYGVHCGTLIDSTRTNHRGRFEMEFITSGNAVAYRVSAWRDKKFINTSDDTVRAGKHNAVTLYASELNILGIRAQIDTNSVGPIRLVTPGNNIVSIHRNTRDTVVYGKVIPMTSNILSFQVEDTSIHEVNNRRKSVDTVHIRLHDTTWFTKKIRDPKAWARDL